MIDKNKLINQFKLNFSAKTRYIFIHIINTQLSSVYYEYIMYKQNAGSYLQNCIKL